jgi:hypothetical protein
MNTKIHSTGNEQSVGHAQVMKWSAVSYQLWYSFTFKKYLF